MRAISLHQPYASLMQVGAKKNETRNRLTHIRGDIAICASKKFDGKEMSALAIRRTKSALFEFVRESSILYGCVLCVVEIYDCLPVEVAIARGLAGAGDREIYFGDYSDGRYAWLTRNCRRLKTPVPVKGHQGFFNQGFFNLPLEIAAQVQAQL